VVVVVGFDDTSHEKTYSKEPRWVERVGIQKEIEGGTGLRRDVR
jgi:hypothetical protein